MPFPCKQVGGLQLRKIDTSPGDFTYISNCAALFEESLGLIVEDSSHLQIYMRCDRAKKYNHGCAVLYNYNPFSLTTLHNSPLVLYFHTSYYLPPLFCSSAFSFTRKNQPYFDMMISNQKLFAFLQLSSGKCNLDLAAQDAKSENTLFSLFSIFSIFSLLIWFGREPLTGCGLEWTSTANFVVVLVHLPITLEIRPCKRYYESQLYIMLPVGINWSCQYFQLNLMLTWIAARSIGHEFLTGITNCGYCLIGSYYLLLSKMELMARLDNTWCLAGN